MCVCVYINIFIYIYIFTHIYIYIYISPPQTVCSWRHGQLKTAASAAAAALLQKSHLQPFSRCGRALQPGFLRHLAWSNWPWTERATCNPCAGNY